ncbi:MAG: hypothetical protein CM1200mP1_08360 [Candidatus Neomarinimicrobiota bacterium]|nr:MAG: hypothetical protein CM1200mP1_08360 [Candidatus Neomarinimicrobiota bacterium]
MDFLKHGSIFYLYGVGGIAFIIGMLIIFKK